MLLEDKDAQIAALKAQNAELAERVARPERLISRNPGNSSMPPGTDDLPGNKPPERRPRRGGGRRPGKQPGAPGAYLAWREHPDKTEDVFPEGSSAYAADLAGAADLGVRYSGRLRSEKTTRDRHAIRGYASTAAENGIAVFTAIRDTLTGNPWMPPIPASA